ncbi:alpha/beta hydrolase family protein [Paucibacter sp. Y2R2-4]|uniref:alpha/beta hydrolase family protein n=1 Tax=Paucibacter sp. Y2R2-4 TaxID=2893553 RepID=UPI0021E41561|nr:prolyl oligopeptidase family serine peptidase [Paucibacter sp. Y2R2-4]MCV2350914.1 prolyl oligopeptidase family serine peptidase [Paucibacter sp. Y2R2-4]
MRSRLCRIRSVLSLMALGLIACSLSLQAAPQSVVYQQPSKAVRELLDAPALPKHLISPDKHTLALLEPRRFSSLAELARPTRKLAGLRFDEATGQPSQTSAIQSLRLRPLLNPQAPERIVELGAANAADGGYFHSFSWAPDGQRFLLERRGAQSNELWVGDSASGQLRRVPGLKLNNVLSQGELAWLSPQELVLLAVPDKRGKAPQEPKVPNAPVVRESSGRASPERTYADLLNSPYDEALLEHYALSQLTRVHLQSLQSKKLGAPALFFSVASIGDEDTLLTERITRPFSYSLTWDDFPQVVEVRRADGSVLREIARLPLKRGVAINGVLPGPRLFFASPNRDGAVFWVEALDGGNPATRAPHRDRLMRLDPPYTGEAQELLRIPNRFSGMRFLDDGQQALLSEEDPLRAWTRSYLLMLRGGSVSTLFEHALRERYRHPGTPLIRTDPQRGRALAQTQGGALLMLGQGASPKGDRPFLDRLSLRDGSSQRLFQSSDKLFEQPLDLLPGNQLLTLHESINSAPSLHLQVLGSNAVATPAAARSVALTQAPNSPPLLRKIRRELVHFKRDDGVEMSFWMYLPPDYKDGEARPTLVWAYPLEFNDAALAGQVSGSPNRFPNFSGISPVLLALEGYVVLNDATMPIVGDAKTVNDEFVEQITLSARAIIEKAEELGVTDPKRVAIGGHSYGAFMAVNLLAHTDLFKVGIARSGAYNRTLTPFGFQSERRSLWEARDTYLKLSPFLYANQIKEPLLLIHGETDNRSGTPALQSERLYQAMVGTGGTVRYVLLPLEAHGYNARESAGHVQWEMRQWLRHYLGEPKPAAR